MCPVSLNKMGERIGAQPGVATHDGLIKNQEPLLPLEPAPALPLDPAPALLPGPVPKLLLALVLARL